MRILPLVLLILLAHALVAVDFSVFEKDGRFGIKDENGIVAVPAVYEQLGWSDNSKEIYAGVIGFKRDDLWGLVSIKNKVLAENKFYTMAPFNSELILASIKGKFSNQLFYGILDKNGEVKISFNYFQLERIGNHFLATEYDQYLSKVGMVNLANTITIPIKYRKIELKNGWHIANRFDNKKDVYRSGILVSQSLDSIRIANGLTGFKNGFAGHFEINGNQRFQFSYKDIVEKNESLEPIEFPNWEIYQNDLKILERRCDSLLLKDGFWTMHLNGVKHKVFSTDEFHISNEYELQDVSANNLVVRDIQSGRWSVLNGEKTIIEDKDSIKVSGSHFIVENEGEWDLFNRFGSKVNPFPMQSIEHGVDDYFMTKRNNYWGIIDLAGETYVNFKYDSIQVSGNYYVALFHGKWGVLDKHGNWKFYPEYEEIMTYGDLRVGKKGASYSYFYQDEFRYKTTFNIISQLGSLLIVKDEDEILGMINKDGSVIQLPEFESIKRVGDYVIFSSSGTSILSKLGDQILVGSEQGYEDFGELGEGYISAKKNGRWGFLDSLGRLRISNRYEDVQPFQENYAAIKLRGRWGFIDKNERLQVQPHYQEVSTFSNGLAIVKENDLFGLINKEGNEVVEVTWSNITRTTNGNYLIENDQNLIGLADQSGTFILRPNFDRIQDLSNNNIIVQENGKMGVLDFKGNQLFKISYSQVNSIEDFILLKQ